MSGASRLLLAAMLVLVAEPAQAHPPPLGIPGFLGGFLHPMFVPAHLMAILGLGLLIGQQGWGRAVPSAFILALLAGLAVIALAFAPRWAGDVVLILALAGGVLTAIARPLPEQAGIALAVLAGIVVALDSPPETVTVREANIMLIGTGLGGTALLVVVAESASRMTRPWQRIGARVLGSWIAASAALVLTLNYAR